MILLSVLALVLFAINTNAQYKVQFRFRKLPSYHKQSDSIFMAGSFNNWNPRNPQYSCTSCNEKSGITIDLRRGMFEYKFTHGGWDAAESVNDGYATENRILIVERDTTIYVDIDHWTDHFPRKPKETTASKNVQILDTAFYSPTEPPSPRLDLLARIVCNYPAEIPGFVHARRTEFI